MAELIPIFGIFFTIGVPVMAIAAHFVLRPMIREVASAILSLKGAPSADLKERLDRLEESQNETRELVYRLVEAERFRHELESSRTPAVATAPGG